MNDLLYCRGKRESGGWVYGYAVKKAYHNGYYIITHAYSSDRVNATGLVSGAWEGYEDIIPETICRATGFTDKNEKAVFDNDIIEFINDEGDSSFYRVYWSKTSSAWRMTNHRGCNDGCDDWCDIKEHCRVVGNYIDSPDLMKKGIER